MRLSAKREDGKQRGRGSGGVAVNPPAKSRDNGEYFPLENRVRRSTARYKLLVLHLLFVAAPTSRPPSKGNFFRFYKRISRKVTRDAMRDRDLLHRTRRGPRSRICIVNCLDRAIMLVPTKERRSRRFSPFSVLTGVSNST